MIHRGFEIWNKQLWDSIIHFKNASKKKKLTWFHWYSWYHRTINSSNRNACCPFPRPPQANLHIVVRYIYRKGFYDWLTGSTSCVLNVEVLNDQLILCSEKWVRTLYVMVYIFFLQSSTDIPEDKYQTNVCRGCKESCHRWRWSQRSEGVQCSYHFQGRVHSKLAMTERL